MYIFFLTFSMLKTLAKTATEKIRYPNGSSTRFVSDTGFRIIVIESQRKWFCGYSIVCLAHHTPAEF